MKGHERKCKEIKENGRKRKGNDETWKWLVDTRQTKMYDWLQIDASQCKYYENTMRILCETASNDRLFLSWNKKDFKEMAGNERKKKEIKGNVRNWKEMKEI